MKRLKDRNQASVGAVALVLVALAALAAFNADDLPIIGGGTTYTAEFAESAGIKPGNEVRLAGVKVGDVRRVELVRNRVLVDFRVRDVAIGDRSRISIEIKTLLGDKFLAVTPDGTAAQDPNDVIPRARTVSPFDIVPAVSELSRTVDRIDTAELARSFQVISESFAHSPQHMRDALTGLSRLSTTLSTRDEQLARLLSNTAALSQTVADRDAQLRTLFTDATLLLDELSRRREAVRALLTGTRDLAEQLTGLVADNQQQLRPALDELTKVTTILQRNQDNLSQGLHNLAPFVRMFNNVVGNGRWFEGYICGLLPPPTTIGVFDINPEGCATPLTPGGTR
ncbi:MAG TPA: MCE family protein [Actinophytocola sp.]|uniref:MCE family protein n=1 Tax=Actinophytocola sp. TaxID=1872138 RepID=UPI002DB63D48|nr:MCE family protein [Actinophytocola sp.]HEU5472389.1 MCE family protein [Actinophytocola sp.]